MDADVARNKHVLDIGEYLKFAVHIDVWDLFTINQYGEYAKTVMGVLNIAY